MEKVTLNVSGMSCGHCENAVKTALSEISGVKAVEVSLAQGTVSVEFDSAQANIEQLKEAIEDQGYDVA